MGFYRLEKHAARPRDGPSLGSTMVGRGADRSMPTLADEVHEEHMMRLEQVRLTGYKFLRPPGISKTLKMLHEEQDYEQETGSLTRNSSIDYVSFSNGPNVTIDPVAEAHEPVRLENDADGDSMDGDFDFTPNLSLPTMDASLPSLYLPPPDTH